ncbi:hypothetical protein ANO11243_087040 [Dothideomycetidae sp. 11243]|nr:hypothetical protein ANO11243_087040 [fungal sp. No.11243]
MWLGGGGSVNVTTSESEWRRVGEEKEKKMWRRRTGRGYEGRAGSGSNGHGAWGATGGCVCVAAADGLHLGTLGTIGTLGTLGRRRGSGRSRARTRARAAAAVARKPPLKGMDGDGGEGWQRDAMGNGDGKRNTRTHTHARTHSRTHARTRRGTSGRVGV